MDIEDLDDIDDIDDIHDDDDDIIIMIFTLSLQIYFQVCLFVCLLRQNDDKTIITG